MYMLALINFFMSTGSDILTLNTFFMSTGCTYLGYVKEVLKLMR